MQESARLFSIAALGDSLNHEASKSEASELLRGLVSEVRLHPDKDAPDGHVIELYGELAAILELTAPKPQNTHRFAGGSRFRWLRDLDLGTVFENCTKHALIGKGGRKPDLRCTCRLALENDKKQTFKASYF